MKNRYFIAVNVQSGTFANRIQFVGSRKIARIDITDDIDRATYVDDIFFRRVPEDVVREQLGNYGFELAKHPLINDKTVVEQMKIVRGVTQ